MLLPEDQALLKNTLVSLSVEESVISELMRLITDHEVALRRNPLPDVHGAWFGGSFTGGYRLATNATEASSVVEVELTNLMTALRQYRESIAMFADDVVATDDTIALSMAGIARGNDCTDNSAATTCVAPTENS